MKGYDICLALKTVRHKPYVDIQLLPIPMYQWKNRSIDFITGLFISINGKTKAYNTILVILDCLIKIVHYKPVKVSIDTSSLTEVIIDIIVRHHNLPNFIISKRGSIFTSRFWFSLCYFLDIKQKVFTAFYPQTNSQTEK